MSNAIYEDGVLREWFDDDTRTVTTYNEAGVETSTRPYTVEENEAVEEAALAAQEDANRQSIEQALDASLATLQAIIDDTNSNINSNPAQRIKELARVQRRLIRLVMRRFEGTA